MSTTLKTLLPCALLLVFVQPAEAQTMRLGEVLVISTPTPGPDTEAFESFVAGEAAPAWKAAAPGLSLHLLRADRGDRDGEYLTLWIAGTRTNRDATLPDDDTAPFSKEVLEKVGDTSTYLNAGSYTDYELIGAGQLGELPSFDILGIHSYKVKPGRGAAFEQFVRDTLHPALASSIPGMPLLYFKAVRGEHTGSYVLVFAIATVADRERYWPTGQPEMDAVRAAFKPMAAIASELRSYLVDGSYLTAEGAAAPVFESLEWTDFVNVQAPR